MGKQNFEKNLFITYSDEISIYSCSVASMNAIASMIARKNIYINKIEKQWIELRRKYNVPDGVYLHFTEIKALLNNRIHDKWNINMKNIFFSNNELDEEKLFNFYSDILEIIKQNEFDLIITTYKIYKDSFYDAKYNNSNWCILFKDHLDDIADYAVNTYFNKSKRKIEFQTKLRYDGDFGLSTKGDLREAYSHCISCGTKKYNPKLIKNVFDELRFINKSEVGFCSTCSNNCNNKLIAHSGSEIIDFITFYAGKYLGKSDMIEDQMKSLRITKLKAESMYEKSTTIRIGTKEIKPIDVIKSKIFVKR